MTRWRKLGVVAGGGALPARIAEAAQARGEDVHVVRIEGFADEALQKFPGSDCGIGEFGKLLKTLETNACDAVVFAGIVRRPNFSKLKTDWKGTQIILCGCSH